MKCYHGSQKEGFCKDYHNGGCIRYDEPCDYKTNHVKKGIIIYPHHCKKCGVRFTSDNAETNGYCFNCCNGDNNFELNSVKADRDHWKAEAERLQSEVKWYCTMMNKGNQELEDMIRKEFVARKKAKEQTTLAEKYKLLQSMCMICVERKCAECKDYNSIQKEADK